MVIESERNSANFYLPVAGDAHVNHNNISKMLSDADSSSDNNADKANGALAYGTPIGAGYMRPYHERYLKQPHLDTGAYLTIMASDFGNDVMSIYMPLMLGWLALNFASGIAVYFITSNLLGIIQYAATGRANWNNLLPGGNKKSTAKK